MKNEMMSSGKGKRKITLDPRTKLALLLMVATFVLGGAGGNELIWARILLAIIPAILLLFSGKVKASSLRCCFWQDVFYSIICLES